METALGDLLEELDVHKLYPSLGFTPPRAQGYIDIPVDLSAPTSLSSFQSRQKELFSIWDP